MREKMRHGGQSEKFIVYITGVSEEEKQMRERTNCSQVKS